MAGARHHHACVQDEQQPKVQWIQEQKQEQEEGTLGHGEHQPYYERDAAMISAMLPLVCPVMDLLVFLVSLPTPKDLTLEKVVIFRGRRWLDGVIYGVK